MADLATNRDTRQLDYPAIPNKLNYGLIAGAHVYAGTIVALNAAGDAGPPVTGSTFAVGVADKEVDNTGGVAGAKNVDIRRGCFPFEQTGTAITKANRFATAYLADNHTVAIADQGKGVAGIIYDVDTIGVWVRLGVV